MRRLTPMVFLLASLVAPLAHAAAVRDVSAADAAAKAFAPTATRTRPAGPPVTTVQGWLHQGQRLPYRSIVSEWPVRGTDGGVIGVVVTQAYVAPAKPGVRRPVTFVYNGGPGAASWSLQMEGIGPKRYDATSGRVVDNPDSILDATDLVFIDPLGTGASFPMAGADASSVWNTPGDAAAIVAVIGDWLEANHRTDSPQLLFGESYGTLRSLAVLHADATHPRLNISGVMLLSLFLGIGKGEDLDAVTLLPSLATTAYVHGLRRVPAASPQQAYDDALVFARNCYAPALLEGNSLSAERLHAVAAEMSDQIGVPAEVLEASRLRIDRNQFRQAVRLASSDARIGSLDTRVVGTAALDGLAAPYNDPSMTLGKRPASLMESYLATLGYRVAAAYRPLNLTINNGSWYFRAPATATQEQDNAIDATDWLADAMRANPRLRVFAAGGYYDIATPLYDGRYMLDHADIDRTRLTLAAYPAGHGVAEDPQQRRVLAADLRAFIVQATTR
ncbi:hypothetical protein ACDH70_12055 [Xanthomonas axonopodis pv. poinsettiicola]|uniref:S10 family serine carboxypeptidase-like protein n=1 Tax=Xanthomonas TaxID=338 RepID=UPI001E4662AB|nr:hypothetical protein [Xanthomonas codiaei]MCC8538366.1 hypothetical protein [Xanthomonas codiaei]